MDLDQLASHASFYTLLEGGPYQRATCYNLPPWSQLKWPANFEVILLLFIYGVGEEKFTA